MQKIFAQNPIGIFDSGIGGLTVAHAITEAFPNEQIIYFGDTAHLPYGEKSADTIRYYCLRIVKFLLDKGCKMVVIACNSAASAAYDVLVDLFKQEALFVTVVDPMVQLVVEKQFQHVGVIATKATISSNVYPRKLKELQANITVHSLPTPLLVPMIEEGFYNSNISKAVLYNYLGRSELKKIDALLLACTHYPLIRSEIEDFYKKKVKVFDSIQAVINKIKVLLHKFKLNSTKRHSEHLFYVSDYTLSFKETTKLFYKQEVNLEQCSIWL